MKGAPFPLRSWGRRRGRWLEKTLRSVNEVLKVVKLKEEAVKLVFTVRLAFESKLANGSEGLRV